MSGRLIGVVGPSGVGKDSLMAALAVAMPDVEIVRRTITRAPQLGGEDYEAVGETRFLELKTAGAFCIDWQAHGLSYGIPADVVNRVQTGETLLVNLSRAVLSHVAEIFEAFVVLNVTAKPEILAARLAARGRESAQDIRRRMNRKAAALPENLTIITVENNGTIEEAAAAAMRQLQPERAQRWMS